MALSEVQRELTLPVDDELLRRLADDAARAHPSYALRSWVGPVPDDLLRGWAELVSTLVTEVPPDDLQRRGQRAHDRRQRGDGVRPVARLGDFQKKLG